MEDSAIGPSSDICSSTGRYPLIWLVIGDKPGDNAQIEFIAEALGLAYEIRRILPKKQYVLGKPKFKASLYHLDAQTSDKLEPPWPNVVLTIGRQPSMAALWIQEQSAGRSEIALVGCAKRWMKRYSLIIVPSQYSMPAAPNVMHLNPPLMRIDEAAVAAANAWRERLDKLPGPLTVLFVGGPTKLFRMDAAMARDSLQEALAATGSRLANADVREFNCVLEVGKFAAQSNECVILVPLAFAYALALCIAGGARRIFLVGFDGFDADDSRQAEMLHLLKLVEPHCTDIEITALTPTNYPVRQGSVYARYT